MPDTMPSALAPFSLTCGKSGFFIFYFYSRLQQTDLTRLLLSRDVVDKIVMRAPFSGVLLIFEQSHFTTLPFPDDNRSAPRQYPAGHASDDPALPDCTENRRAGAGDPTQLNDSNTPSCQRQPLPSPRTRLRYLRARRDDGRPPSLLKKFPESRLHG